MSGPEDGTDEGAAASDDSATRILHFDPDETVLSRLGSCVEETEAVEYVGTTEIAEASDSLGPSVDVLVVEQAGPEDVTGLVADAEVPVTLYTTADPSDVDEAVFAAADTLVEKWTASEGLDFVVEKVCATAGTATADSSRLMRAFDPVDAEAAGTETFLLYTDGTVVWETAPLDDIFERHGVDVPGTPNFYRRLAAVVSDDSAAVRAIRGPEVPPDPVRFTVPTDDGEAHFRYTEHEFPETFGPVRLVVVEDVTPAAVSDVRLELLELLDQHTGDGIAVVDASDRIAYHNDAFGDLLGHDDVVGDHTATHVAEGELSAVQQAVGRLRSSGCDGEVVDVTVVTADGEERTLPVHLTVRESGGEYGGFVAVVRDVGE